MNVLEEIIRRQITQSGPMDIGQFMSLALSHPKYGYYMKQDPFGLAGDFVTAPEISQMFGEVIGAWAAHSWMQMGAPAEFVLLECGPGRGTLLADILRATKQVRGFHDAARLHLLEMSPVLKDMQAKALDGYSPHWHEGLDTLPADLPIIIVANEFLDALPFRSLVYLDGAWFERVVGVEGNDFVFMTCPCPQSLWPSFGAPRVGDIYEFSFPRMAVVERLCQRIKAQGGAGLVIDYGHGKSAFGDTFQGVKGHSYVHALEDVGNVDLTSHVDFEPLYDVCCAQGCASQPLMEQGVFLKMMGIEMRAAFLKEKSGVGNCARIEKDLHRLTDAGEMGAMFKVMDIRYGF